MASKRTKAKESLQNTLKTSMGICCSLALLDLPRRYDGPHDRDELTRLIKSIGVLQSRSIAAMDQFKAVAQDLDNL